MIIRKAIPEDADEAAYLMNLAIDEIGQALTGETEEKAVVAGIAGFFRQRGNRLSYENVLTAEENGEVIGMVNAYPGMKAEALDLPLIEALKRNNQPVLITCETEPEDYYIDTLCVKPGCRGKKIGTKLLKAAEEQADKLGIPTVSLNVEAENEGARKLYQRLGWKKTGTKQICGHVYDYMVKPI